jgi:hypothetical protein
MKRSNFLDWLLAPTILFCTLTGCARKSCETVIELHDLSRTNSFVIVAPDDRGFVHTLSFEVTGYVRGTALLKFGDFPPETVENVVNYRVAHDWFSTNCPIQYAPITAETGKLSIHYTFRRF